MSWQGYGTSLSSSTSGLGGTCVIHSWHSNWELDKVCFTVEGSGWMNYLTLTGQLERGSWMYAVVISDEEESVVKCTFFQDCSLPSVCLACFYLSLKPQITALLGNYLPWADFITCTFVLEGTPYVTMIPWQVYIPCRSWCEIVNNDLLFFILLL